MWMVAPGLMCDRHLLGEHVELHMLAGCLEKHKSIRGYLDGLVNPALITLRHEQLVAEMSARRMNHRTPIAAVSWSGACKDISAGENLQELAHRCEACAARIKTQAG